MHDTQTPTLQELLTRLDDAYVGFLIDAHPEAFETELEDDYDDRTKYLTVLKPSFDVSYNAKAQRLGYRNAADFVGSELAEDGIFQPLWVKQWSEDRLAKL